MEKYQSEISDFKAQIIEHYKRLDNESIWFFVSTIGCWSITVTWVKLMAMAMIFYYSYKNVFDGLNSKFRPYPVKLKSIRENIELSDLEQDYKNKLFGELWGIEKEHLKLNIKDIKFLLAWVFYFFFSIYFLSLSNIFRGDTQPVLIKAH